MEFVKSEIVELVALAINNINDGVSKTLTARKSSEIPPQDARHLTDTRTRVSTLLEYALSYEMNIRLANQGEGDSISNVLWNVFPDLIVRDAFRNNRMGLEIKALHTAAEEKSANLSTPLPVIRKEKDLLIILVWGWVRENTNGINITYPHIHHYGVFDAWLLAKIRDTTWLINDEGRVKGIDVSTAVLNDSGSTEVKAEEGNMGKLMRISLSGSTDINIPYYTEMLEESERYNTFKNNTLGFGVIETIKDICFACEVEPIFREENSCYPLVATLIATTVVGAKNVFFVAGPKRANNTWNNILNNYEAGDFVLMFGTKLNWKVIELLDVDRIVREGLKPDSSLEEIRQILNLELPVAAY